VFKNSRLALLIAALPLLFVISGCGTSGYLRRADGSRIMGTESFKQAANETINKYTRGQCNLYVQDLLRQYGISLPGLAEDMIFSLKKSPDWKKIGMEEANDRAGRAQIVLAVQLPPKPNTAAHVSFVLYNRDYKPGKLPNVIGTYILHETGLNYEFDLSKPPPVEFYYYKKIK